MGQPEILKWPWRNIGRAYITLGIVRKGPSFKPDTSPESELNWLLYDLCVQSGYCNSLTVETLAATYRTITAQQFACAVLTAERLTPEYEKQHRRLVEEKFIRRFGPQLRLSDKDREDQASSRQLRPEGR